MSDLLFLYGIYRYLKADVGKPLDILRLGFNYASAAFIILDNIHFQYNSMMYGLLILSLAYIKEDSYFKSALVYAVLLNFKHIFLYFAPCFGILYLKRVVFNQPTPAKQFTNFCLLALQTVAVFAVSFGPFLWVGGADQMRQIASRLFPFQRGLVHTYQAANVWAFYFFFNKYVVNLVRRLLTGEHVPFDFDLEAAHSLETYKLWTMAGTLLFLVVR